MMPDRADPDDAVVSRTRLVSGVVQNVRLGPEATDECA
jgi:hypothetical protein